MDANTIAGFALVVSCISVVISVLAYRHTKRAFRASHNPILKLIGSQITTGSYTDAVAAERIIGTNMYFRFQNLSDSVSITDIALSTQIARSRKDPRFWKWQWISLDTFQHITPIMPHQNFKYNCSLIEVLLSKSLPDVLQEKGSPHRHYQVLKSYPLRLRLKVKYLPGVTGAKHLSTVVNYNLHPVCKSTNGCSDELEGWNIQEM